jgi:two-component system cell cycle sensor histidine kinase/response regulator CckA
MRRDLEQIRQAGERAADLTRRLLAFSRQQLLQPTVLDLNAVVHDVEPMLKRLIGEHIELVTNLGLDLAPVKADAAQIEQIILNLAVNARDAMPAGGRLTIETGNRELDEDYAREHVGIEAGPHVLLEVSDTGVGMDARTQSRLFEPFFTTKPPGQGTGLGLATVFGIVQQSGGHIGVTSTPNQGASFEIYLPRATEQIATPVTERAVPSSFDGTETILLVEDEPAVRHAARRFLEEHGYRILEAANASDALRLCNDHDDSIDLVVTDVVMPGMSGHELARRIGESKPEMRVLYLSGYVDHPLSAGPLSESTTALLAKPFSADALANKVREVLDAP